MSETPKTPNELINDLGSIFKQVVNGEPKDKTKDPDGFGDFLGGVLGNLQNGAEPLISSLSDALSKATGTEESAPKVKTEKPATAPNAESAPKPAPKTAPKVAPKTEENDILSDLIPSLEDLTGLLHGASHIVTDSIRNIFGGLAPQPVEQEIYVEFIDLELNPGVDIVERKDGVEFRLAIAGASSEDLTVELDGDELHVTVVTPKSANVNINDEALVEFAEQGIWSGVWEETFLIPNTNLEGRNVEIDAENITANVKNGLATIVVPFKEQVKATIKVS